MSTPTLKPCPSCGSQYAIFGFGIKKFHAIICNRCGVRGPESNMKHIAVKGWQDMLRKEKR